jgi:signal transduction histidine kinase
MAFNLAEELELAVRQVAFVASAKGIFFERQFSGSPVALGDAHVTRRIATNLLSNAVKFSDWGGRVSVTAGFCEDPALVEFAVTDAGIGMSADELKQIGKPFARVGDAYRSTVKGTGLGLAISKNFVEAMGGQLSISSTRGHGTVVRVRLPAASDPADPSPDRSQTVGAGAATGSGSGEGKVLGFPARPSRTPAAGHAAGGTCSVKPPALDAYAWPAAG